jgi:hypothetical protein
MRRSTSLGAPLIVFAMVTSTALAQDPSTDTTDHSAHHGQADQATEQPSKGGGPMMGE